MLIFLLVAVTILLANLANLLHAPLGFYAKSVDENVKLIAERPMSCISDLWRIERGMRLISRQKPSTPGAPCGVEFANNLVRMIKAKGFRYRT